MVDETKNKEQTNITGFILSSEELQDLIKNNQTVLKNRTADKFPYRPQGKELPIVASVPADIQEEIYNMRVLVKDVKFSQGDNTKYDLTIELKKDIVNYPNTLEYYGS